MAYYESFCVTFWYVGSQFTTIGTAHTEKIRAQPNRSIKSNRIKSSSKRVFKLELPDHSSNNNNNDNGDEPVRIFAVITKNLYSRLILIKH
jgi:hypothetical protein